MSVPKNWIWYKDIMHVLVRKDISVRYKGSVLGVLWSLLNPLMQAFIYYLVFGVYMRFDVPHYLIVLLSALFPWQWIANCLGEAPHVFTANPTLVKKVAFPRQAIPLVMNVHNMVHFLLSIPIYMLFMLNEGLAPSWIWLVGIPLLCGITLLSIYGLSLFLGSLNLFLKDIGNLTIILIQMAFFATPIMYTLGQVSEEYLWCFKANPLAPLMISWRSLLFENTINMEFLPYALGYALFFMALGYMAFTKLQKRFAEVM